LLFYSNSFLAGKPAFLGGLLDTSGKKFKLSDFKGKAVLIDFWFTGCTNCIKASRYLERLEKEFDEREVVFVSICIDEDPSMWKESVRTGKYSTKASINLYSPIVPGKSKSTIADFYQIDNCPAFLILGLENNLYATPLDPRYDDCADMRKQLQAASQK
jgi:thiol-disulfide isomerase/thioredoxin